MKYTSVLWILCLLPASFAVGGPKQEAPSKDIAEKTKAELYRQTPRASDRLNKMVHEIRAMVEKYEPNESAEKFLASLEKSIQTTTQAQEEKRIERMAIFQEELSLQLSRNVPVDEAIQAATAKAKQK